MSHDAITYEGKDVDELRKDFEGAVDYYINSCKADGKEPRKPYSGNLNVRLTPEIHSRIASIAQQTGTTINGFIKQTLAKAVGLLYRPIIYVRFLSKIVSCFIYYI